MSFKIYPRRSWVGSAILMTLAAVMSLGCTPEPSVSAIGTNQRFTALVNGDADDAIVQTLCGGPVWEGRMGYAVSGQTVSASLDPTGDGNTGDNGAVFVLPDTNAEFVQLRNWNQNVEFPTDIQVPCDGTGVIAFDPCFGFVGCRGDAEADVVKVTFQNIAD